MSTFTSVRLNLEVTDLTPTVAFLSDVLDMTIDVEEEAMGLAVLHRDEVSVAVVRTPEPGVNQTTAGYLTVTDVDQLHDRCLAQGATIAVPLTDRPWGLRDFVVEIPGGHKLALGQPIA